MCTNRPKKGLSRDATIMIRRTATTALALALLAGCASRPGLSRPAAQAPQTTAAVTAAALQDTTSEAPAASARRTEPLLQRAYAEADANTILIDSHIAFLASPSLKGRLPGTPGSEAAKNYIEWQFRELGLRPAFTADNGTGSFRQPFEAGTEIQVTKQDVVLTINGQDRVLTPGVDFNVLGNSASGRVPGGPTGRVRFVGYGVVDGPRGYNSFGVDNEDVGGRVAMLSRFEPMDGDGQSLWARSGWSNNAALGPKFAEAANRDATAILFVTPSHADDPRAGQLESIESTANFPSATVPVIHLASHVADEMISQGRDSGIDLEFLLNRVTRNPNMIDLDNVNIRLDVAVERQPRIAQNVGAILPGSGELAGEILVIGAHHDHVGLGYFGTRSAAQRGQVHAGADDNASGTAGVLLAAKLLSEAYAAMPEDAPRRSVLFMTFDAEESGLNGARHYVANPIAGAHREFSSHYAMLNLDMIGRVVDATANLSGLFSADELESLLTPVMNASPLTINTPKSISARSDHYPFYQAGIPALFITNEGLHTDYHTPADEVWKLNRVGAARVTEFIAGTAAVLATSRETLTYAGSGNTPDPSTPSMGSVKVRFGIAPGSYDDAAATGVLVGDVFPNTSAAEAGVLKGDRMIEWNGKPLGSVTAWMPLLADHEPGDVVTIKVIREGEPVELEVTLQGRGTGG